ncbi:MAG TPA: PEP-CTERM sorting domain-containing protein [Isosphaeraceae bacterium]|jgi:hypothetical protein
MKAVRPLLLLAAGAFIAACLTSRPASAQSSYLAVSEIVNTNGQGQVLIYKDAATPTLAATISGHGLTNPYGMAFYTTASSNDLYIASLGSNQIFDYNLNTSTISSVINLGGTGHYQPNDLVVSNGNLYVSMFDAGSPANAGAVLEYSLTNPHAPSLLASFSGGGLQAPTGLAVNGSTVYVNSSQTGKLFDLPTVGTVPVPVPLTANGGGADTLSAPAGMLFNTVGQKTFLYDTNFFSKAPGSSYNEGIVSYQIAAGAGTFLGQTTAGFGNGTYTGGPADIVAGSGNQVFVSDYGDGLIYAYTADGSGSLTSQATYLNLGPNSTPGYMAYFTTGATVVTPDITPVPEPSSIALLSLGAVGGLIARYRYRRANSPG